MPVRLIPGLRLRCMQRSAGSGRGRRIRPVCESAQQGMVQEMEPALHCVMFFLILVQSLTNQAQNVRLSKYNLTMQLVFDLVYI